jgi:hypothetical protein
MVTQTTSGGRGKDITTNNNGAFADRGTSIECKQSYCYIKARETSSGLPPALSTEVDFHEPLYNPLSISDEARNDWDYITEDEKFARVHSLRPQSTLADSGTENSESLSDEEVSTRPRPQREPASSRLPRKQVRFAPRSAAEPVSRPLTRQEAWSLYYFETHARACHSCSNMYGPLCDTGHNLSQDVQVLIHLQGGKPCSTQPDSEGKWVRVEILYGYNRSKAMLGIGRKRERNHAPIISYEGKSRSTRQREPRNIVSIEPARRHRPDRDEVIEVTPSYRYETGEAVQLPRRFNKLGSYDGDMGRPRREDHVEDPGWRKRRKERRRERRREQESRDSDSDL